MTQTDTERFFEKVDKSPHPKGCWLWTGSRRGKMKYGGFWLDDRTIGAHHASWEIHFGTVPAGKQVLHTCDNPPCVNPDHLFIGTNLDNIKDKVHKNRQAKGPAKNPEAWPRGATHCNAKLTETDVVKIRAMKVDGVAQNVIARMFNVTPQAVFAIVHRKLWRHVA